LTLEPFRDILEKPHRGYLFFMFRAPEAPFFGEPFIREEEVQVTPEENFRTKVATTGPDGHIYKFIGGPWRDGSRTAYRFTREGVRIGIRIPGPAEVSLKEKVAFLKRTVS
jgi:hypothetical protein